MDYRNEGSFAERDDDQDSNCEGSGAGFAEPMASAHRSRAAIEFLCEQAQQDIERVARGPTIIRDDQDALEQALLYWSFAVDTASDNQRDKAIAQAIGNWLTAFYDAWSDALSRLIGIASQPDCEPSARLKALQFTHVLAAGLLPMTRRTGISAQQASAMEGKLRILGYRTEALAHVELNYSAPEPSLVQPSSLSLTVANESRRTADQLHQTASILTHLAVH